MMGVTETTAFDLQWHVDQLTQRQKRRLALEAETPEGFQAWQRELRNAVTELLGLKDRKRPPSVVGELMRAVARDGYVEEKYALEVGEEIKAPIYVLVPDRSPPFKPVLVFHGHSPSVQYVLGNYPSPEVAQNMRARDGNYAQALAQAGYLVCAVEQRGFGERQSTQLPDRERSCRHLAFNYAMTGRNLLGERVWDGMCATDFVLERDDIVQGSLGCTGNSGGGTTALWLSALDERITVAVPSAYFCSFSASIGAILHCECNYLPGILEWAEMGELAALIAPRPLRLVNGENDRIFPVAGARQQYETVKRAYALLGVGDRCSLAVHPGEHRYDHALSHEWFSQWL